MRRRTRVVLGITSALCVVLFAAFVVVSTAIPARSDLLAAASGADRLVLEYGGFAPAEGNDEPLLDIRGEDTVDSFLATIHWNQMHAGMSLRCACDGNYHVNLYRGNELLVSLGLHHGESVRWRDSAVWNSDVPLTVSSKQQMGNWFADRGFAGVRQMTNDPDAWIDDLMADAAAEKIDGNKLIEK